MKIFGGKNGRTNTQTLTIIIHHHFAGCNYFYFLLQSGDVKITIITIIYATVADRKMKQNAHYSGSKGDEDETMTLTFTKKGQGQILTFVHSGTG